MYLTDKHLHDISSLGEAVGADVHRHTNNTLMLLLRDGDPTTAKVHVRRLLDGTYNVEATYQTSFLGGSLDFVAYLSSLAAMTEKVTRLRDTLTLYLAVEVNACTPLPNGFCKTCTELVLDHDWVSRPDFAFSPSGFSARDSLSLVESLDKLDDICALDIDTMPDRKVRVWYDKERMLPLVNKVAKYLASRGFEVITSTERKGFFMTLGDDGDLGPEGDD